MEVAKPLCLAKPYPVYDRSMVQLVRNDSVLVIEQGLK
jgi:hypothetical protein